MADNSHRKKVKDVIRNCLESIGVDNSTGEVEDICADEIFKALDINKDEQDSIGGMFVHVRERVGQLNEYVVDLESFKVEAINEEEAVTKAEAMLDDVGRRETIEQINKVRRVGSVICVDGE